LHDAYSTPQERAAALRRLQQIEAEQASAERARTRRVLDIDFKTGRGSIRNAVTEDLIPRGTSPSPSTERVAEKVESAKVEIVNGFPKPTFIEA
jgi:hypothetical protein